MTAFNNMSIKSSNGKSIAVKYALLDLSKIYDLIVRYIKIRKIYSTLNMVTRRYSRKHRKPMNVTQATYVGNYN